MKTDKKLIILFLAFISIVSIGEGIEFGIGYTADVGLHLRAYKFELQSMFDKDFTVFGLRYYPIQKAINIAKQNFGLYFGVEGNYVSSDLLDYGYSSGIFGGLDKKLYKGLHLGIDLGIFVCTLKGWE
ncbi:MAG: hypothetical protein ACK4WJ_03575, partial [Endomicrobiia bacterium]